MQVPLTHRLGGRIQDLLRTQTTTRRMDRNSQFVKHAGTLLCALAPAIAFAQAAPTRPAPPAAYPVGAAYDSARARLVVFGGYVGGRYVGDTWEWDGAAWTKSEQPG